MTKKSSLSIIKGWQIEKQVQPLWSRYNLEMTNMTYKSSLYIPKGLLWNNKTFFWYRNIDQRYDYKKIIG